MTEKHSVVFITFYDHCAFGARSLAADVIAQGHEAALLVMKMFRPKFQPHEKIHEMDWLFEQGHKPVVAVQPFDAVFCPYPHEITEKEYKLFWDKFDSLHPDIAAFSLTSVFVPLAQKISVEMRKRYPHVLQQWGGIHPTLDPVSCLEYADIVCVGEGEGAMRDMLADTERLDIPNLWRKDPRTGEIVKNPCRPLIQDLDSLVMPLYGDHDFVIEDDKCTPIMELPDEILIETPIITSQRGCPFGCTYCLHGNVRKIYSGQKYLRRKSVDRFLDDLEVYAKKFPLPGFNMFDDVFVIGKDWIDEFCQKYTKRFPGVPFASYAHPATSNLDMLKKIRAAGGIGISLGIQTGSDRLNKQVYNRHTPMREYIRIGKEIVEAGFDEIVYDIMTRCEFETEDDYKATADLLSKMPKPFRLNVKRLVVYPFAPIGRLSMEKAHVPDEVAFFYEMLFLLDEAPGFDPKMLPLLIPAVMSKETIDGPMKLMRHLYAEKWRREELERTMPWGVRRSLKHLTSQTADALKRHL